MNETAWRFDGTVGWSRIGVTVDRDDTVDEGRVTRLGRRGGGEEIARVREGESECHLTISQRKASPNIHTCSVRG